MRDVITQIVRERERDRERERESGGLSPSHFYNMTHFILLLFIFGGVRVCVNTVAVCVRLES